MIWASLSIKCKIIKSFIFTAHCKSNCLNLMNMYEYICMTSMSLMFVYLTVAECNCKSNIKYNVCDVKRSYMHMYIHIYAYSCVCSYKSTINYPLIIKMWFSTWRKVNVLSITLYILYICTYTYGYSVCNKILGSLALSYFLYSFRLVYVCPFFGTFL